MSLQRTAPLFDQTLFAGWSLTYLIGVLKSGLVQEFPLTGVQIVLSGSLLTLYRNAILIPVVMRLRSEGHLEIRHPTLGILGATGLSVAYSTIAAANGAPIAFVVFVSLVLVLSLMVDTLRTLERAIGKLRLCLLANGIWTVVSGAALGLLTFDVISFSTFAAAHLLGGLAAASILFLFHSARLRNIRFVKKSTPFSKSPAVQKSQMGLPLLEQMAVFTSAQLIGQFGPTGAVPVLLATQLLTSPTYLFAQSARQMGLSGATDLSDGGGRPVPILALVLLYLSTLGVFFPLLSETLNILSPAHVVLTAVGLTSFLQIANGTMTGHSFQLLQAKTVRRAAVVGAVVRLLQVLVLLVLHAPVDSFWFVSIIPLISTIATLRLLSR